MANFSSVQIFVGLIFMGVACPLKLVLNKNICIYGTVDSVKLSLISEVRKLVVRTFGELRRTV